MAAALGQGGSRQESHLRDDDDEDGDRNGEVDGGRDRRSASSTATKTTNEMREERRWQQGNKDVQGQPEAVAGRERPVEKVGGCRGRQRWPAAAGGGRNRRELG
mgnify:CR=1 FL=1